MAIPIEQVRTDTFEMDYFRFGHGPRTMVILPGLSIQSVMGSAEAVAQGYAAFAEDFTVYLFDRRKDLPPVYPVRAMAEDTAAALAALGLSDVYLFGASQGGMMALVIAIEHPELVHRMVLGSTAAHVPEEQVRMIDAWIRLAKAGDGVGLYLDFGEKVYPPAVFAAYSETLAAAGRTVQAEDLSRFVILAEGAKDFNVVPELRRIRCPVLVIGEAEDAVLGADATMEIAEKLDYRHDFQLYLYNGFGHAAYDTAPDYRARILRFFSEER